MRWFRNGVEIEDAGKFIIETKATVSILDIAEVDLDDGGEYKFVVSNEFGESESIATLVVNGGDGKLTVGFNVFIFFYLFICHKICFLFDTNIDTTLNSISIFSCHLFSTSSV